MTLGNIGQSSRVCETYDDIDAGIQSEISIDLFCSYGEFSDLEAYYVGEKNEDSTCSLPYLYE